MISLVDGWATQIEELWDYESFDVLILPTKILQIEKQNGLTKDALNDHRCYYLCTKEKFQFAKFKWLKINWLKDLLMVVSDMRCYSVCVCIVYTSPTVYQILKIILDILY